MSEASPPTLSVGTHRRARPADRHAFWRSPDLPFIEAREVHDGRKVCYDRHAHATFSVGVITGGECIYWNQGIKERAGAGTLVLMNPEDVHACNPAANIAWSYRMIYVDVDWLTRQQLGCEDTCARDFRPFSEIVSTDGKLYRGLNALYDTLTDQHGDLLSKESAAIEYFHTLCRRLEQTPGACPLPANLRVDRAAEYIDANCTDTLRLADICKASGLSPAYLIRAFKTRFGMTPHAWLINRRIRFAQSELKRGRPLADVALAAGFADQAHFQRLFKRHVAATPRQYTAAQR